MIIKQTYGGGVAELITRRISNLRITGRTDSYPVSDKPLFASARNFTLIAHQYRLAINLHNRPKINSVYIHLRFSEVKTLHWEGG